MLVLGDRLAREGLAVEVATQHEGAIVLDLAPVEAEEGVLGLEVTDLQDAIDLGGNSGPAAGERQFGFGQRKVFQPLGVVEIRQAVQGFLLGVRQYSEQLIFVAHHPSLPLHAIALAPTFRSAWCA